MKRLSIGLVALLISCSFTQVSFAQDWLVRSKTGKTVHTLWADGTTTQGDPKTDHTKKDNRCHSNTQTCKISLSGWNLIAYGVTGVASKFVTYRNPEDQQEVVQVFYDTTLSGEQITSIIKYSHSTVDGSVVEEDASDIYIAASTYIEALTL